jgi:hypothetical protein
MAVMRAIKRVTGDKRCWKLTRCSPARFRKSSAMMVRMAQRLRLGPRGSPGDLPGAFFMPALELEPMCESGTDVDASLPSRCHACAIVSRRSWGRAAFYACHRRAGSGPRCECVPTSFKSPKRSGMVRLATDDLTFLTHALYPSPRRSFGAIHQSGLRSGGHGLLLFLRRATESPYSSCLTTKSYERAYPQYAATATPRQDQR